MPHAMMCDKCDEPLRKTVKPALLTKPSGELISTANWHCPVCGLWYYDIEEIVVPLGENTHPPFLPPQAIWRKRKEDQDWHLQIIRYPWYAYDTIVSHDVANPQVDVSFYHTILDQMFEEYSLRELGYA